MKRWVFGILIAALLLAAASLLWAQTTATATAGTGSAMSGATCPPGTTAIAPGTTTGSANVTQNSEYQRCSNTCNTVMPYYRQKYSTLRTHEGDAQCWNNCWCRFGNTSQTASVGDQKALWQRMNAQYLRANQCAQTCYRKYHGEQQQAAISVAGFRSTPRPWVAAGQSPASPVVSATPSTSGMTGDTMSGSAAGSTSSSTSGTMGGGASTGTTGTTTY